MTNIISVVIQGPNPHSDESFDWTEQGLVAMVGKHFNSVQLHTTNLYSVNVMEPWHPKIMPTIPPYSSVYIEKVSDQQEKIVAHLWSNPPWTKGTPHFLVKQLTAIGTPFPYPKVHAITVFSIVLKQGSGLACLGSGLACLGCSNSRSLRWHLLPCTLECAS